LRLASGPISRGAPVSHRAVRVTVNVSASVAREIDDIWRERLARVPFASWQVRLGDEVLTQEAPERVFSGASMLKTPLAALISEDVVSGQRQWCDAVQVAEVLRAPGDGLLSGMKLPRTLALDEALMLMIAVSDNTATNAVIDALGGLDAVNARLAHAGWRARVRRSIGGRDVASDAEQFAAESDLPTPAGFGRMTLLDHQDALAKVRAAGDRAASPFVYQQDRRSLARWLSPSAAFAHKTGTIDGVRHDAGVLIQDQAELWVACFTDGGSTDEYVDHPSCVAMASAMRDTLRGLGLTSCLVDLAPQDATSIAHGPMRPHHGIRRRS
jgi:beta-lactamase class A